MEFKGFSTNLSLKNKSTLFFLLCLFICKISFASKSTWNGSVSISWSTAANWTTSNGGSAPPSTTDTVVINSGNYQPVLPNSSTTLNTLILQSANIAAGSSSTKLTITNGLTINAGQSLNMTAQDLTVSGTFTISGTFTTTGGTGYNYKNVIINSGGSYITTSSNINVTGNWTNNGTFTYGTSDVYFKGTIAQTLNGNFYTLRINNGSGGSCSLGGNITVNNDLVLSSGVLSAGSNTITLAHDLTNTGLNLNAQTSTIVFNGTGNQSIDGGSSLNNVIVNGTNNTVQPSGNITINGNLTVTSGTFDENSAGRTITGNGASNTLLVQAAGTVIIRSTGTTPYATSFPGWETLTLDNGSTVEWGSGNAKTWDITALKNVVVSAGTNSLGGNTTITGDLTFTGGTLTTTTSNYSLTTTGNFSLGGATLTANGSTVSVGGNFSGTGTLNSGTSTFVFNGTGAQTIAGTGGIGAYNNITINKASGTASTTGTLTLNGNATISSGTLDIGTYTFQRASSGGTFTISNGAYFDLGGTQTTYNFTTYTLGASSTVNYSGAAQTLFAATYGNLILSGSGTKTMPSSAITVAGDFTMSGTASTTAAAAITFNGNATIGSGTTFSGSSYSHSLKGNWNKAGTFNGNTSTFTLNGTSAQILTGATTFNNLTVNNSSGITLSAASTVGGTLTLTSGLVTTGSYELNVTNTSASSITGHSASSYVVGNLRRSVTLTGSYDFPLGTSSNYEFINLNFTAQLGVSNVLGTFTGTDPAPSGLPSPITYSGKSYGKTLNHGYWSLTPNSSMIAGVYSVTLKGKGYTNALSNGVSDYVVIKRHDVSSSWGIAGLPDLLNQLLGGGILTTIATGLTSFSDFAEATTCDVTASAAGPDQSVCGTSATLAANTPTVGTGAWSIVSGTGGTMENTASAASTFTGTAGSTYSLKWTISNSPCSSSADTVVITFKQSPTTANAGTDQNICGTSATLAGNTPAIGAGTWSVITGSGGSFSNSSSATPTFTGTAGTSYTLRWTIANSPCSASTDDVVITFSANPTVPAAGADRSICGTITTLAGNIISVGTGTWSIINGTGGSINNPSSATSGFTGIEGTAYTLRWTVTNSSCNAVADDVVITCVQNPATPNAGSDQNICGTSASLNGNTPSIGTGTWSIVSGTGGTISSPSSPTSAFTGVAGTSYTLRWMIINDPCNVVFDDVIVNLNSTPSAAASASSSICNSSNGSVSISVSNGTSPFTYAWSDGSTSQNISGLSDGNYSVSITDANGCSTSTSAIVSTYSAIITASVTTSNASCSESNGAASVIASDGNEPYSYSWSNGSTSNEISSIAAGNYSVTITDANGCTGTSSAVIINSSTSISASVSSVNEICNRRNGSITLSISGGSPPYSYAWSNGASTNDITGLEHGNYSVSISDEKGCTVSASVSIINSSSAINASISNSPYFICTGSSNGTAAVSASGGASPYNYIWSNGATTQNASGLSAGTYSVTVTDANGCSIAESITIPEKSAPSQPDSITVTGASFGICPPVIGVVLRTNNDPDAISYSWTTESPGVVFTPNSSTNVQTINLTVSGNSTYTIKVAAINTCGTSPLRGIGFRRAVSVPDVFGSAVVCPDATQTYSCSKVGATSYKWTGTGGMLFNGVAGPYTTSDTSVNVSFASTFNSGVLSVAGTIGCFTSAYRTLTITKNMPSLAAISGITPVCPQSSQTYTLPPVPGAVSYNWTLPVNATGISTTNSIDVSFGNFTAAGNLCVQAVNSCGVPSGSKCIAINPGLPAVPGAITGSATQVCGIKTYSVAAVNGITCNWIAPTNAAIESGQGTNSVTVNFSSGFISGSISVTSSNSCGSSTARTLAVSSAVSPPGTISGQSVLVCAGTAKTYSVPAVTGIGYNWTAPVNASIASGQGSNNVMVSFNSGFTSGSLSVSATNGCANSAARTLGITSLPSTPGTITGPSAQVCAGSSKSYSITPVSGVTYNWTAPANAVISGGQGTNNVTVDFNNSFISGTLSVIAVAPCGSSAAKTLMITSLLTSPVSISGPVNNNCEATSLFTTKKVTNAISYSWRTSVAGAVVTPEPAPNDTAARITFPAFTIGTVSVGADNTCGTSPLKTITISGAPSTPGIITTNPSPVCANAAGVQFTSDVSTLGSGYAYLWTYPSSATYAGGQGTSALVLNWGSANGTVTLKATNNCGSSVRSYGVIIGCARVTGNNGQNSNEIKGSSQTIEPIDDNSLNLQAYPDADQKTITFTFNADKAGSYTYSLYDDSNREIMNGTIDAQEGVNMQELDMASSSPDSVYRLKLDNGTKSTHINIKMK